jgi:hypothetical protein
VKSLGSALPKMSVLLRPRKCAHKDCSRNVLLTAISRKAAGISVQGEWFCGPDCFESALAGTLAALHFSTKKELPSYRGRVPLGLTLLARGDLSRYQLEIALDQHRATGVRLGDVIQHLGFATEEQVTSAVAAQCGHPVFPLRSTADTPACIPTRLLELSRMLPVHCATASRRLLIGFADGVDYRVLDAIRQVLCYAPSPCIIAASEYRRRLESIVAQTRGKEVVFDGESSPQEMAQILRSYAVQINAEEMRFAICCDHLWTRLKGRRHEMDLLFRLTRG